MVQTRILTKRVYLLEFIDDQHNELDHFAGNSLSHDVSPLVIRRKLLIAKNQLVDKILGRHKTAVCGEEGLQKCGIR